MSKALDAALHSRKEERRKVEGATRGERKTKLTDFENITDIGVEDGTVAKKEKQEMSRIETVRRL